MRTVLYMASTSTKFLYFPAKGGGIITQKLHVPSRAYNGVAVEEKKSIKNIRDRVEIKGVKNARVQDVEKQENYKGEKLGSRGSSHSSPKDRLHAAYSPVFLPCSIILGLDHANFCISIQNYMYVICMRNKFFSTNSVS